MEQFFLKLKHLLGNSTFHDLITSNRSIDLKIIFDTLLKKEKITKEFYDQVASVFEK